MALAKSDRMLMLVTGGALVLAAAFFASVLVFATGAGSPSGETAGPLYIGQRPDLVKALDEGSPLYFANPFGGRGFWLDRENGDLVALDVGRPGDTSCSVRWKGRVDSYVDCRNTRLTTADMARYDVTIVAAAKRQGAVLIDLESRIPPVSTE